MADVDFGKTNIELEGLEEEVDLDRAKRLLSKKDISDPGQKLEICLGRICEKIRLLPEDGDRFPCRGQDSVYRIYIAEILLQRTHGSSVEEIYFDFFECFENPSELYHAEEAEIKEETKPRAFRTREQGV